MQTYAYIRVSTREQNEDRQVIAVREFSVDEINMVIEKQSGKDFERPMYQKIIKKIKPGDTLVIKSIDRLGRNYEEILDQWHYLTKEKHIDIVVLDMPLLDTRTGRDLTGTLISDIVLQLLSYAAQTEREFIRQRQREGILAAQARGVHCGRTAIKRPPEYKNVKLKWERGELSGRGAAEILGISHTTFQRWTKQDENNTKFSL